MTTLNGLGCDPTLVIEPRTYWLKIILIGLCVAVTGVTLSVGLWPFSFHAENQVSWRPEQAGLYFGSHGMLISGGRFSEIPTEGVDCSIELWLEPALTYHSGTILSFYDLKSTGRMQLRQSGEDLAYIGTLRPENNQSKQQIIYLDNAFQKGGKTLITLTSSKDGLEIYSNGVLKKIVRNTQIRGANLAGTLIVANSPYGNLSWTGTFRGLAIYDRALRPEEINQDFGIWQRNRELMRQKAAEPYLLYLFNEQGGETLHNLGQRGPDLVIPKNYFILQPGFLVPFWREYRPGWNYAKDLAINVFGLVPLGFCFAALFSWLIGRNRSLLYATLLGFCVSLTIEILQAFMPTRYSGTTDLITKTSGTALGGWFYLNTYSQVWLKRLGFVRAEKG